MRRLQHQHSAQFAGQVALQARLGRLTMISTSCIEIMETAQLWSKQRLLLLPLQANLPMNVKEGTRRKWLA